jgi:phenylalanyl-tRNA synthetase beta chain
LLAPLSWLRDFAPFDQPIGELASALSNLGLVVEGVTEIGGDLTGVEVVRILSVRAHPNADKIRLVDVDRGDGQPLQIACGAPNLVVGELVPLATVGALLPGAVDPITRRKMRGEWSNGMLCSRTELGLPDDGVDGLAILPPASAQPGNPVTEALGLVPDVVFDLDITPNRPDALSMAGVARDLAAAPVPADPNLPAASVAVADPDLCPRLTGTVVTGVVVGPSPTWLADRLLLAGMRPVNNVVDVSNYVMLHLGQPNHAYDLDRLGGRGLVARAATEGETLNTLDGVTRSLSAQDGVIADAAGRAVGVAGIMGGAETEISASTTTVLLEAAYFTPMAVARTGKRLGLHSEARARFERGVDPEVAGAAVDLFVSLLAAQTPGVRRGETTDVRAAAAVPTTLAVRTARHRPRRRGGGRLPPTPRLRCHRRRGRDGRDHRAHLAARRHPRDRRGGGGGPPPRIPQHRPAHAGRGAGPWWAERPPEAATPDPRCTGRHRVDRGLDHHLPGPRRPGAGRPARRCGRGGEPARRLGVHPAHLAPPRATQGGAL